MTVSTLKAWLRYPRAHREFVARVTRSRRRKRAELDAALARMREQPCDERTADAARLISERLGFEEEVRRVARLSRAEFVAEASLAT